MIFQRFLLLLLPFFASVLYADIGVSPMVVDLTGKDADAEIAVKNFDIKNNAYVEITPFRLMNPANPSGAKKRVRHPEKDGLVVFPAKLVLLPGQTQFVRILKTAKALVSDQVYEVDFIPKKSSRIINKTNSDGVMLGIRVIVGYGTRVTLRPDSPHPSLVIKRSQKELQIQNTGNTSLQILSCTQMISGKKTEIPLPAYTIFAGQIIKKALIQPVNVTLDASFMGKSMGLFYSK